MLENTDFVNSTSSLSFALSMPIPVWMEIAKLNSPLRSLNRWIYSLSVPSQLGALKTLTSSRLRE